MATYSATRSIHKALVATVADTINFDAAWSSVMVINRGSSDIYYRADGTVPTVMGDDCLVIPSGEERALNCTPPDVNTVIKLISNGIPGYSLEVY